MFFEGRELKNLPRPVSSEELRANQVYFKLIYLDTAMLIPQLDPVVFIGRDLDPAHPGEAYFQDYTSHQSGISFSSHTPGDGAEFFIIKGDRIGFIFDYENALDELIRCSLNRKKDSGGVG